MAVVYQFNIAPHQKRLMQIREQRWERWHQLHDHAGRAKFWVATVVALAFFWSAVGWAIDQMV